MITNNLLKPFTFNCKEFIIDEIALEGLEGIGINLLWKRLEARIRATVTEKMKTRFWNFITNCKCILIYKVGTPLPDLDIVDRLTIIHPETGYLMDPDDYLDGPYEYSLVDNAYGCSAQYNTRTLVSKAIQNLSYEEAITEYGDKLALVATIEERWTALAPQLPLSYLPQLGPVNFSMLELIGRSRENGQMTTGKTNLTKIVKDSKILFYHRKALQNLDLVRVTYVTQVTGGRALKSLLIRLKRFHKTDVLTVPKSGLVHELVEYLRAQPNFCEKTDVVIKKGLMTQAHNKKFQKKVSIFHFEENPLNAEQAVEPSTSKDTPKKPLRKRYMYLVSKSDESSQSEDEETNQPLKCQYKVGVNILRQAYERFLDAGRNGLTQNDLAQLIGVEFYISRTICRIFKNKNIIREFMEYKGRQRLGRYIAIAATSKMDSKLAEEKEKLQKLLDKGNILCKREQRTISEASSDSEALVHIKKRKLENLENDTLESSESNICEVEVIDRVKNKGLNLESKLTIRQLKFASGILKILHEKAFIMGYRTLSNLVAKEYGETPMDTKALKLLLQGMITEGHIKIYKIKMPRSPFQYTVFICGPHVKPNHPLLKAKYKDLVQKFMKTSVKKKMTCDYKPLTHYAYPRYVKAQKLHEELVKIVYLNDVKFKPSDLGPGFFFIQDLIPELTVGVALGHITSEGYMDITKFTIGENLLNDKIRNSPPDLCKALLNSKNLHSSLRSVFKILASFGLLQLIVQSTSEVSDTADNSITINLFYVNKRGKLIDTKGVWPRENVSIQSLEKEFIFNDLDSVHDYWQSVYHISTNTAVDVPDRKKSAQFKPPIRTNIQALLNDKGERWGDGLGPCGFDSSYYLDVPRLWKTYSIRNSMKSKKTVQHTVKFPNFERTKKVTVQKSKPKVTPKKNILKKSEIVKEFAKRVGKPHFKKKKKTKDVFWSPEEDRLLMMCKTAITVMSPISQPGCLQVRNLVAKDILTIRDPKKTQSVCHRRAAVIESNSTLIHERNLILNELRRNDILPKYEGLLKKLRILHSTSLTKYINEARIPMMELVWILYNISLKQFSHPENQYVAISYEDFHKKYTVVPSTANVQNNLYRSPHDSNIVVATLKESIILIVMLSSNNEINKGSAKIIYTYLKRFPESVLRIALDPLRKSGVIAAKDKILNSHMHVVAFDDLVQSSYRVSANYHRRWISRLNSEFVDGLFNCITEDISESTVKASPETNCFCFELQSNGLIDIEAITIPVITGPSGSIIQEAQLNVIDIANNYKLKSGTIGWKRKGVESIPEMYKADRDNDTFDVLSRRSFIAIEDLKTKNVEHSILSYLKTKREKGATFAELQEHFGYERKVLIEDLVELQSEKFIKRVGFYENVVVLLEFVKDWCMTVSGGYVIPVPWLTMKSEIRHEIFFKWAGVIMNKIFEAPGSSILHLSESCEILTTRGVQDICEVLEKSKCVKLQTILVKKPSLFSDDDYDNDVPEITDYSEFESPNNLIVMPLRDCLLRYSAIMKKYIT